MVHDDGPVGLDGLKVAFDDERAVSDAGVALVATLAQRLGLEALAGAGGAAAARSAGGGQRRPQGDGAALRDGARRRLDR